MGVCKGLWRLVWGLELGMVEGWELGRAIYSSFNV